MMSEKYLNERVAMVTGGASGMGRAMAIAFASLGADVAIGSLLASDQGESTDGAVAYLPGEETLRSTQKEIEALGVRVLARDLDVCSMDSVTRFYDQTIEAFGKVDILANAAGVTVEHAVCGHPDDLWMKVMDVNANGIYRTIKVVLPDMIQHRWGRIINIASTAASVGAPTSGAYCASKAAVVGLTRCVALEGASHGVTCNAISPGWVETDFGRKWMTHIAETQENRSGDAYIRQTKAENPQMRMIQPEEIANAAAFLCREESLGITGQDITISAGSIW
jgi:NAD(P)-dependent dehydrogenase (short-subunit alcohol dehydrogenase family)